MSFAPDTQPLAKPESLLRVPVGLASPLWGLFAGAAMTGATWWSMTRWTRPQNLEALFGAAEVEAAMAPEVAALAAPVVEPAEALIEAAAEPVAEAVVDATPEPFLEAVAEITPAPVVEAIAEAAPDPVLEALVETPAALDPVGGESAPISRVVAALTPEIAAEPAPTLTPAPKPKKKAVTPPLADAAD
jgi:hypothetical protein